jgi:tRNA dimethylallyltransferase
VPPPGVVVAELERPRPELYRRVDLRATRQWSDGRMLQEARRALDLGADPAGPALWALGYRQAVAVLRGRLTPDEAVRLTARDTRHLAKRQLAYWRAAPWLVHVPAEDAVAQLCRLGEAALAGMSAGAQGRGDDDAEDLHANR